jgi:tol-pal system protein YbgF
VIRRLTVTTAALAGALALPACVPLEKGRQLEARIQRLEVQNVEQRDQREALRERIAKADQKIAEVQAKIDELNAVSRKSGANLSVELGKTQDEFARVKGELEASQHRLADLESRLKSLQGDTDARFAALKGAGALDDYEAKQKLAALKRPDDKAAVFDAAQKEEQGGDKGVARQMYDEYARRWPSDPRTAEARFRAGELAYGQKRWRDALLSYGKVAEDFPRADVAPDAMFGAANAMVNLDMKDDARAILEQLVEKYPKSKAAARAKERLAELAPAAPAAEKKKPAPTKKK